MTFMSFQFDDDRDQRWRTRLHDRLTALIADPRFDVVAAHAGETLVAPPYPVHASDIAIRWFERDGSAQGELHWLAIEPDAGDGVKPGWFVAGSEEFAAAKRLRHFEDHPDGGEGIMVLGSNERLFFHDSGQGVLLPLAIGFADYVELQIAALGLGGVLDAVVELREHGWSAASESARHAERVRAQQGGAARATLAEALRLFPDQDFTLLERRIAALEP